MILTGSDNVLPKDWYNCVFTAVQVSIGAQAAAITLTDRLGGGGGGQVWKRVVWLVPFVNVLSTA